MLRFRFPNQLGFSVVEIILAAGIFMIISGAAIVVVLQGFDSNRTATEMIVANQYAIEGIDAVRSIQDQSYANLAATAGTGLGKSASNTWTFSGVSNTNSFAPVGKYTRVIAISSVMRDTSGNIVGSGGITDPNTMKVTSTVTWNHTPTRVDKVVQTTYLTNWEVPAQEWYNTSWVFRKAITIDHTKVSATQTNFPVLINLTADTDLKNNAQASGNDILFTDSTGLNKIPHEIETYTSATGALIAWVNVPTVSSTTDTTIYMYYDNPSASNQQNSTGVWDSNYKAVLHLDEPSGNVTDSTSNGNNGVSSNTSSVAGVFGTARSFSGVSTSNITVADNASLDFGANTNYTTSIWFNTTQAYLVNNFPVLLFKEDLTSTRVGYSLYMCGSCGSTILSNEIYANFGTHYHADSNNYNDGNWHYAVGERSGTTLTMYVDGALVNSAAAVSSDISNAASLYLGRDQVGNGLYNGKSQEMRISNIARPAGWILTEYRNQSSPSTFYSLGSAQLL